MSGATTHPQAASTDVIVRADDLTLGYGDDRDVALQGVGFELRAGETLGIVGEAGSGKSTLLRAIACQVLPGERALPHLVSGDLQVFGQSLRGISVRGMDRLARRIGYLPQDGGSTLEPRLTVTENVAAPVYLHTKKPDRAATEGRVAELVDAVRLPLSVMDLYPHELSRGQRQRIALARALMMDPDLLVADDPTMGVDVLVRGRILAAIADLQAERGFSAILVGHELRELRTVIDRVAVLQAGIVVGYGEVDQVLGHPLHPYVERLAALQA